MNKLAPSILAADFGHLAHQVAQAEQAGADMLHLDVMDGHFVPNISFGVPVIAALRPHTKLPFDVHLMISEPHRYVDAFADAGADNITIHVECDSDIQKTLSAIHERGLRASVSLNPETPLDAVLPYREQMDMLLVMSVHPGFGGQRYIMDVNDKIARARALFGPAFDIQVDGGISLSNLHVPLDAGANVIVAGSAVFGAPDIGEAVRQFRKW